MSVMKDPKSRSYARFAGALYLSVAFIGPFSILYVPSQINVAGDAAATMANRGDGGDAALVCRRAWLCRSGQRADGF
ncbi:MAG: hypothetical protein P8X69_11685 [Maritimibacter sp.]